MHPNDDTLSSTPYRKFDMPCYTLCISHCQYPLTLPSTSPIPLSHSLPVRFLQNLSLKHNKPFPEGPLLKMHNQTNSKMLS